MKTQIRAARKPQRSFVPITPFEFESFEVRVGRVTRHRPFSIGVSYRKVNVRGVLKQFKTIPGPVNAVHHTKILLPSPSLQGHGLMCLRSGARLVDRPAALPSRQLHASASNSVPTAARGKCATSS
jgi:hypothetical protein